MATKVIFSAADLKDAPFTITDHGIHWPWSKLEPSPPRPDDVARAAAWIAGFATPRKTPNTKLGSYGFKHVVENWVRRERPGDNPHVSNGAFIQAALDAGYAIRVFASRINCEPCMSFEPWEKARG